MLLVSLSVCMLFLVCVDQSTLINERHRSVYDGLKHVSVRLWREVLLWCVCRDWFSHPAPDLYIFSSLL